MFEDISADSSGITEVESLCMNCHKNGMTRLLLSKIPFHGDLIVSSFECPACGFKNNEVQSGQAIQEQGIRITLRLFGAGDFQRMFIRSEHAVISIPEIDLEIPASARRSEVTNVESILKRTADDLQKQQSVRHIVDSESALKIDVFLKKLEDVRRIITPASLVVDDPTGNSHIQGLMAPTADPGLTLTRYRRTRDQDKQLGLLPTEDDCTFTDGTPVPQMESRTASSISAEELNDQVLEFPTDCPECHKPCTTKMKLTDVPHFKQVVIMATNCESCGSRTNEVKSGAGISPLAQKITLNVTGVLDMHRDVLKSETCAVEIPELDLVAGAATTPGRFTTVEGLLVSIKEGLRSNSLLFGDSSRQEDNTRFDDVCRRIDDVIFCKIPAHIVLDDPAGNSYIQNTCVPAADPQLVIENYERTSQQNEGLGLNDMKIDNYSN